MNEYPSDLEIAQAAEKSPISEIAKKLDIQTESNNLVPDPYHLGIKGTKIVSILIFDKLKELNYL